MYVLEGGGAPHCRRRATCSRAAKHDAICDATKMRDEPSIFQHCEWAASPVGTQDTPGDPASALCANFDGRSISLRPQLGLVIFQKGGGVRSCCIYSADSRVRIEVEEEMSAFKCVQPRSKKPNMRMRALSSAREQSARDLPCTTLAATTKAMLLPKSMSTKHSGEFDPVHFLATSRLRTELEALCKQLTSVVDGSLAVLLVVAWRVNAAQSFHGEEVTVLSAARWWIHALKEGGAMALLSGALERLVNPQSIQVMLADYYDDIATPADIALIAKACTFSSSHIGLLVTELFTAAKCRTLPLVREKAILSIVVILQHSSVQVRQAFISYIHEELVLSSIVDNEAVAAANEIHECSCIVIN